MTLQVIETPILPLDTCNILIEGVIIVSSFPRGILSAQFSINKLPPFIELNSTYTEQYLGKDLREFIEQIFRFNGIDNVFDIAEDMLVKIISIESQESIRVVQIRYP